MTKKSSRRNKTIAIKKLIKDKVSFFEPYLALTEENMESFNNRTQFDLPHKRKGSELEVIISVVNDGWKADFNNDEKKYYPLFYGSGSAFRFLGEGNGWTFSAAHGGSRFALRTRSLAEFMGEIFVEYYRIYQTE